LTEARDLRSTPIVYKAVATMVVSRSDKKSPKERLPELVNKES